MKSVIKIGTRGSQLALYQAELVKDRILREFPMITVEVMVIKTSGDMIRRGQFSPFETKRIFTREIEDALVAGEIDLAVHSAKDMSVTLPESLEIGAVLEREDSRDCLVTKEKKILSELPLGARIGTSSVRRRVQLLRWNGDLQIEDIRGNVDTRLHKVQEGHYDAIVLAYAGIKRLGLSDWVAELFPPESFYPSPCQGIIAIENRLDDQELAEILKTLDHHSTHLQLKAERSFLRTLEGGCQLPCGIHTAMHQDKMILQGGLFAIETREWAEARQESSLHDPEAAGARLAHQILDQGGKEILKKIRGTQSS